MRNPLLQRPELTHGPQPQVAPAAHQAQGPVQVGVDASGDRKLVDERHEAHRG